MTSTHTLQPDAAIAAIDRALHFDTATSDGPGWQPGDPLHDQPVASWWATDEQLHDVSSVLLSYHRIRADGRWCDPCDVGWVLTPDELAAVEGTGVEKGCWSCGQAPTLPPTRNPHAHFGAPPLTWTFTPLEVPTLRSGDTVVIGDGTRRGPVAHFQVAEDGTMMSTGALTVDPDETFPTRTITTDEFVRHSMARCVVVPDPTAVAALRRGDVS